MPSTQGIIDFALSPPLGVLTPVIDGNGPYGAGNHILSTWLDGATTRNVSDSFGCIVQFSGTIPPFLGFTVGGTDGLLVSGDEWELRIVQILVLHQLFGGSWVTSQWADVDMLPWTMRWTEALPGKVVLYVSPSLAVDIFFLRAL